MPEWVYYFVSSKDFIENGRSNMSGTGGLQRLTKDFAMSYKIPLPPLKTQQKIVAEIEAEQQLVDNNKKLIEIFEQKIKAVINKVYE